MFRYLKLFRDAANVYTLASFAAPRVSVGSYASARWTYSERVRVLLSSSHWDIYCERLELAHRGERVLNAHVIGFLIMRIFRVWRRGEETSP